MRLVNKIEKATGALQWGEGKGYSSPWGGIKVWNCFWRGQSKGHTGAKRPGTGLLGKKWPELRGLRGPGWGVVPSLGVTDGWTLETGRARSELHFREKLVAPPSTRAGDKDASGGGSPVRWPQEIAGTESEKWARDLGTRQWGARCWVGYLRGKLEPVLLGTLWDTESPLLEGASPTHLTLPDCAWARADGPSVILNKDCIFGIGHLLHAWNWPHNCAEIG